MGNDQRPCEWCALNLDSVARIGLSLREPAKARNAGSRRAKTIPQLVFESCVARPNDLLSGMCRTREPERYEKLLTPRESSEYQAPCRRFSVRDNELPHLPSWRCISDVPLNQWHISSHAVTHPIAVSAWPPVERITLAGDRPRNSWRG